MVENSFEEEPQRESICTEEILEQVTSLREKNLTAFRSFQEQTRKDVQALLMTLARKVLDMTAEKKTKIVDDIRNDLLNAALKILCPICHKPANVYFQTPGRSKSGSFMYQHTGRDSHSTTGKIFPPLTVIIAPPKNKGGRQKKKSD